MLACSLLQARITAVPVHTFALADGIAAAFTVAEVRAQGNGAVFPRSHPGIADACAIHAPPVAIAATRAITRSSSRRHQREGTQQPHHRVTD